MAVFFYCSVLFLFASNILAIPSIPNILPVNQPNLYPLNENLNSSNSVAATLVDFSSLQASNLIDYLVPNTPTTLRLNLNSTPIEPQDMARTILQTQVRLRRYITTHYQAANDVLFSSDDPYTSEPEFTGCFFAVMNWPSDRQKHLTYGMVENVLKGVWEFLYRGGSCRRRTAHATSSAPRTPSSSNAPASATFPPVRGLVQDGAAAILALLQQAQYVFFHYAGRYDLGRLLITKTYRDCTVTVDLIESNDMGTWTSIDLTASLC
ncbi:MAG: hypothetical protein Q9161_008289 [Pseudevernia consocians]